MGDLCPLHNVCVSTEVTNFIKEPICMEALLCRTVAVLRAARAIALLCTRAAASIAVPILQVERFLSLAWLISTGTGMSYVRIVTGMSW